MNQATTLIACLITLQASAKTQEKPIVEPKPHPEVQRLIDKGLTNMPSEQRYDSLKKAFDLSKKLGDACGEGTALFWIARLYQDAAQHGESKIRFLQSIKVLEKLRSQEELVGSAYNGLSIANRELGFLDQSISSALLATDILKKARSYKNLTIAESNAGLAFAESGLDAEAERHFNLSLKLSIDKGFKSSEGVAYLNLGRLRAKQLAYSRAIQLLEQAMEALEQSGDAYNYLRTILDMGLIYAQLGDIATSFALNKLAIEAATKINDDEVTFAALFNIGVVFQDSQPKIVREMLERFLEPSVQSGNFLIATQIANTLLLCLVAEGDFETANALAKWSQFICMQLTSNKMKSLTFHNISVILSRQNDNIGALHYLALSSCLELPDSKFTENLSRIVSNLGAPSLAIVFAKQSVNFTQSIRGNTRNLERALQDSFTSSVKGRYQHLVDMLLSQGRVPEALTVLSMLKSDEYNQLWKTRSKSKQAEIALTPLEQKWLAEYEKLAAPVGKLGLRQLELGAIEDKERTAEQVKELKEVSAKADAAQKQLEAYIQRHKAETSKLDSSANRIDTSESLEKLTKVLKSLPNATAIYTVVTDDGVRSILAKDGVKPFSPELVKVKKDELTKMVVEFRQQLENPSVDPRELGAKLYDLLIRPLEKNFTSSEQLLWSLDSVLRYVPIWALYDKESKQFFIEKYPSSLFTPGTMENLVTPTDPIRTATGLGISEASGVQDVIGITINFSALPGAKEELGRLEEVFGVKPLLNEAFDEKSLKAGFGSDLLHVATHFRFQPGSTRDSFLVLGKNQKYTLGEFKDLPDKTLSNVDLLVLSACDTGVGTPNADGSEFEGLALLAQQKGAGAIMASLWPVNDDATSKLMGDFYTFRKNHPEWSKVEALRKAQLRMIRGENKPREGWKPPTRDTDTIATTSTGKPWPASEPIYKHPYYWAPFVITGNVK